MYHKTVHCMYVLDFAFELHAFVSNTGLAFAWQLAQLHFVLQHCVAALCCTNFDVYIAILAQAASARGRIRALSPFAQRPLQQRSLAPPLACALA